MSSDEIWLANVYISTETLIRFIFTLGEYYKPSRNVFVTDSAVFTHEEQ